MTRPDRLYGLPGAERLHFRLQGVWEHDIDPYRSDDQFGWAVEEWTVTDPVTRLGSPEQTVEQVAEWISDVWCHDPWPSTPPSEDPRCLDLARQLHDAIAACVTWHQAGELVGTHRIVLDADGQPTLDGEPLFDELGRCRR